MIDRIKQSRFARVASRWTDWAKDSLAPALLRRRVFGVAGVSCLLAVIYWGLIASDRYVSEAHILIQKTDIAVAQSVDFSSLLGGASSASRADQLLLRDYLLSTDMLFKLDKKLNLRAHYSDWGHDPLSRMWFEDAPLEIFHRYYRSRVSIEYDEHGGLLVIKAQGYDPKTAQAIAVTLVEEGERFMNSMAHELAREQVVFLERQVREMNAQALAARQTVLEFQNQKGLVSPQTTIQNFANIVGRLEATLAELQTRRASMLGYMMPDSPTVVDLDLQIEAVNKQIEQEKGRLASTKGSTLNQTVEQYQRLQMDAEFSYQIYKTALVALEKGRIEATRTLKKVSVMQRPPLPEYSVEPRRLYNTIVFILVALLIAGIVHLLAAIIRDHKD